jgi:hypothetical protein
MRPQGGFENRPYKEATRHWTVELQGLKPPRSRQLYVAAEAATPEFRPFFRKL